MSKEIFLPTNRNADRPIAYLQEHGNLRALIDSGARFPVWMSDIRWGIARETSGKGRLWCRS